jgi:PPOX class probable F420-dependent enzyme
MNLNTKFGRKANRRLKEEVVVWLTTVDDEGTPQPRPVWYDWDGKTCLIFSEPNTGKLRHIERNPKVALNLSSDREGAEVIVLVGRARSLKKAPDSARVRRYLRRYRDLIKGLGMTAEQFQQRYSVPVLVTPNRLRGW